MAIVLSDTFTGTNGTTLQSHMPDIGAAWEQLPSNAVGTAPTDGLQIFGGVLQTPGDLSTTVSNVYRNGTDPGSDEYTVEFDFNPRPSGPQAARIVYVLFRMTPTGTADASVDRYQLIVNNSSGTVDVVRWVGGASAATYSQPFTWGTTTRHIRIEVLSTGCEVYVNDVLALTVTDTAITQRGRVGVCMRRANAQTIDNFQLDSRDPPVLLLGSRYRLDATGWVETELELL